jgi:hypothetical protein
MLRGRAQWGRSVRVSDRTVNTPTTLPGLLGVPIEALQIGLPLTRQKIAAPILPVAEGGLRLPLRRPPFSPATNRTPRSDGCVTAGRRRPPQFSHPPSHDSPLRRRFVDPASPGASRLPWPLPDLASLGSPLSLRGSRATCEQDVSCACPLSETGSWQAPKDDPLGDGSDGGFHLQ